MPPSRAPILLNRHVYLAGFRGTGKSAVGRALAPRLQRPMIDLDSLIQERAGCSITQIFAERGERDFRRLESEVLLEVARRPPTVVALGGGAVLAAENRRVIRNSGVCVLLDAPVDTIVARIAGDAATAAQRPALTALDRIDEVRHLLRIRHPFYRSVADLRVPTDGRGIEAIADEISRWIACRWPDMDPDE